MKLSVFIILIPVLSYSQNFSSNSRLTLNEIQFITTCNMVNLPNKVDSVLRMKSFNSQKMEDGEIIYINDFGELYYSGYTSGEKELITSIQITDYGYFSKIKKDLTEKFKREKVEKFRNYSIAEYFATPINNLIFIAGIDQERNEYAIFTVFLIIDD